MPAGVFCQDSLLMSADTASNVPNPNTLPYGHTPIPMLHNPPKRAGLNIPQCTSGWAHSSTPPLIVSQSSLIYPGGELWPKLYKFPDTNLLNAWFVEN